MLTSTESSAPSRASTPTRIDRIAISWSARSPAHDLGAVVALSLVVFALTAGLLIAAGYSISHGFPFEAIDAADRDIAAAAADRRTPDLNRASEAFDTLADTIAVIVVVAATVLVVAVRRAWRRLVVMAVAIPLELLTYVTVSFAVGRPRPDEAMGMLPITPSFPSGHAAMAVTLYGSLAFMVMRSVPSRNVATFVTVLAAAIALAVAWARAYAALHYTSDVLFGLLLGGVALTTGIVAAHMLDVRRPTS